MTDQQRKGLVAGLLLVLLVLRGGSLGVSSSVTTGPKRVVLVYESSDNTPAFARLVLDLRDGEAAKYLASKNHTLTVIDRDAPDPNGDRSKLLAKWSSEIGETPVVLVLDSTGAKLVGKGPIDKNGAASAVVDIVKKYGG